MSLVNDSSEKPWWHYTPPSEGLNDTDTLKLHVKTYVLPRIERVVTDLMAQYYFAKNLSPNLSHNVSEKVPNLRTWFSSKILESIEKIKISHKQTLADKVHTIENVDLHERKPFEDLHLALQIVSLDTIKEIANKVFKEVYSDSDPVQLAKLESDLKNELGKVFESRTVV